MSAERFFTVGGAVSTSSGVYIEREADKTLLRLCQAGLYAHVLAPRQMGKTSLRLQTGQALRDSGSKAVNIDLNVVGVTASLEQWYVGILTAIEEELDLTTDAIDWWEDNSRYSPPQRLARFLQQVVLVEVPEQIVIFVDEIDMTLGLAFTDDFFALTRAIYEARDKVPAFGRLSFVFLGVATPNELIKDSRRTPFNIGEKVEVTDFTMQEARVLAKGLGLSRAHGIQVLAWVLEWTGGHPYLTQRVCQRIAEAEQAEWTQAKVYHVVKDCFFVETTGQDTNLQFVRDMLTKRTPNLTETVSLYRAIWTGLYEVPDEDNSPIIANLKLSGVVRRRNGNLRIRNKIYAKVFDEAWLDEVEAMDEVGDLREVRRLQELAQAQKQEAKARQRQVQEARQRAEAERLRAEEQIQAATQLRRRAYGLAGALGLVVIASIFAVFFAQESARNANQFATAEAIAVANANAQGTSQANAEANLLTAQYNATQQAIALEQANNSATREAIALVNSEESLQEAEFRATAAADSNQKALDSLATSQAESTRAYEQQVIAEEESIRANIQQQNAEDNAVAAQTNELVAEARASASIALQLAETDMRRAMLHAFRSIWWTYSHKQPYPIDSYNNLAELYWERQSNSYLRYIKGDFTSVTFSGDSNKILVGSLDGTIQIWTIDGILQNIFNGHNGHVNTINVNHNDQRIVTSGSDGLAKVWLEDGTLLMTIKPNSSEDIGIRSAIFSPDGQQILLKEAFGIVRILSINDHTLTGNEIQFENAYNAVFTPDSKKIILSSEIWSTNGDLVTPLSGYIGWAQILEYEQTLMVAEERGIKVFDLETFSEVESITFNTDDPLAGEQFTGEPFTFVSNQTGDVFIVTNIVPRSEFVSSSLWSRDGYLLNNLDDLAQGISPPNTLYQPNSVISPNDNLVAFITKEGIILLDLEKLLSPFTGIEYTITNFSPDNQRMVTVDPLGIVRLSSTYDNWSQELKHKASIKTINFAKNGQEIITVDTDYMINVWNKDGNLIKTSTFTSTGMRSLFAWQDNIEFSLDGEKFITLYSDDTIRVWNIDGKLLGEIKNRDSVSGMEFDPTSQSVYTLHSEGINVWSLTGTLIRSFDTESRPRSIAFSSDGKNIVTGHIDGIVNVWTLDNNLQHSFSGYSDYINYAMFSPDGTKILTVGKNDVIRIWTTDGTLLRTINKGFQKLFDSIAFSPDGKEIITTYTNRYGINRENVKFWDFWTNDQEMYEDLERVARGLMLAEECLEYLDEPTCAEWFPNYPPTPLPPSPTPSGTPILTPTATATLTPTVTPSSTPTLTATVATPTSTPTLPPTITNTPIFTATPTPTITPTATITPTLTPITSETPIPEPSDTPTPSASLPSYYAYLDERQRVWLAL